MSGFRSFNGGFKLQSRSIVHLRKLLVAVQNLDAEMLDDGWSSRVLQPTVLSAPQMRRGSSKRVVSKVKVMFLAAEDEPGSVASGVLNNDVLVCFILNDCLEWYRPLRQLLTQLIFVLINRRPLIPSCQANSMVLHPFILTDSSGAQKMVSSILSVCDCSDFPDGLGETRDRVDFRFRGEIFGEAGDIGGDERRSFWMASPERDCWNAGRIFFWGVLWRR